MCRAHNNLQAMHFGLDSYVTDLKFTDKIFFLGQEPASAHLVLDRILCETVAVGQMIHISKNEFFTISQSASQSFHVNDEISGQVL